MKGGIFNRGRELPALEPTFQDQRPKRPEIFEWTSEALAWAQWRCAGGRLPRGVYLPPDPDELSWSDTVILDQQPAFEASELPVILLERA